MTSGQFIGGLLTVLISVLLIAVTHRLFPPKRRKCPFCGFEVTRGKTITRGPRRYTALKPGRGTGGPPVSSRPNGNRPGSPGGGL